ncbi:MAG: hypothetical protein PUP46_10770 [Endozoicomonas sp. (ex Botrylloides leachii)]|nr:hypothetical protein [Endozoicomonas sp. (ex Botrylloides leachii)]
MSERIENISNNVIGNKPVTPSTHNTVTTGAAKGIASDHNEVNSIETVIAAPASISENISLELPETPETTSQAATETLEILVSNNQLAGLKEVVSFFNSKFDINTLDMADTASVLLFIKGMISDMRTLSSAENIDSALNELTSLYNNQIAVTKSVAEKQNRQDTLTKDIRNKQDEILLRQAEYDVLVDGMTDEEISISLADATSEISLLANNINDLSQAIGSFQTEQQQLTTEISQLSLLLQTEITSSLARLFSINQSIRQRYDQAAIKTGEKQRLETAILNVEDEKTHNKRKKNFLTEKQFLYKQNNDYIDNQLQQQKDIKSAQSFTEALKDTNLDEQKNIIALLDTIELNAIKPFLDEKEIFTPNKNKLVETINVLKSIIDANDKQENQNLLINPDNASTDRNNLIEALSPLQVAINAANIKDKEENQVLSINTDKATKKPLTPLFTNRITDVTQEALPKETFINESSVPLPSESTSDLMAQWFLKMEARKLEADALYLVIEAEKERLETKIAISKRSPV